MTSSTVKPKIIFTKQPAYGGIVNGFFGVGIRMSIGGFDGLTAGWAGVVADGWAGVEPGGGTGVPGGVDGGWESSLMGRGEDILFNVHCPMFIGHIDPGMGSK